MAALEGRALEIVKEGQNYAIVAVPLEDGSVQSVIVWAHADEKGNVTLNSAEGRAWPENLRKAKRATVTMMADGNPYEYVSIRGRLIGDTQEGADEDIDRLAMKYLGEETYPFRQEGEVRVRFTLEPEKVVYLKQG
jgi:hypothetical protein